MYVARYTVGSLLHLGFFYEDRQLHKYIRLFFFTVETPLGLRKLLTHIIVWRPVMTSLRARIPLGPRGKTALR